MAILLWGLLVPAIASGAPEAAPVIVVYPTGSYPLDLENVQAALDQGGPVLPAISSDTAHLEGGLP